MKIKIILAALIISSFQLFAQEEDKFGINFSGFVSSEAFFDTRQEVTAREGDVLLYPANEKLDINSEDINEKSSFNFLSIHSRLKAGITGPRALGAKTSGVLEFDFVGTGNSFIHLIRMRHAFVNLAWDKTSVLFGQYWHPMFVTDCYPTVASWGAAVPISVLARNPQIRLTHKLTSNLFLMAALLSQRDFTSSGPDGASSQYVRNSGIPEVQGQLGYKTKNLAAGAVFGYKTLVPQIETSTGYKTENSIGSYNLAAYFKLVTYPITLKIMGYYGQNFFNYVMLGGYAESSLPDPVTGEVEYTNYKTSSYWTEINTNGETVQYALFAGITNNLGTDDEILGATYARGTNIDYVYRISPRVSFLAGKFKVTLESVYTAAAYGTANNFGVVENADNVSSLRFLLSCMYKF